MKVRRRIALITSELEGIYQQRIMKGIFSQCQKYDYDVVVITSLVNTTHFMQENLEVELNIYNIINFDLFDGIVITPTHLFGMDGQDLEVKLLKKFQEHCHCKVVALDMPFGDYEVVYTDEVSAFYEITKHIFEQHWRRNVYFLNGTEGYSVSTQRLAGFKKYCDEQGIEVPENHIFYGDFWYTSGEKLADDIANGAVDMPDAIICASDHMAIGVANRLMKYGIRVPDQVAVTGYDTTQEAAFNDVYIASYEPKEFETAARAINVIHSFLEPDAPMADTKMEDTTLGGFRAGESCGCSTDTLYLRRTMKSAILHKKQNWSEFEAGKQIDIGVLLETYMSERVMSARDFVNCLDQIYHHVFLMHPYGDFWLCLKENWLDLDDVVTEGYPEKMRILIHSQGCSDMGPAVSCGFCDELGERSFETKLMLPEMHDEREEASVFYYVPVHFGAEMYGYAVMRCPLTQKDLMGYVYHNWLRIVSNGLSMARVRNELFSLSMRDSVTGLLNRRGMMDWLIRQNKNQGQIYAIMIDMDGLKFINDYYGHSEGDFALKTIADTIKSFTDDDKDVCARLGGDEFLMIGVGNFCDTDMRRKVDLVGAKMEEKSKEANREFQIVASMGYAVEKMGPDMDIDELLECADVEMYRNKRRKYKERKE